MFINLGGRGKPLKISDQTFETWTCVWPEYGADESAAYGSAGNPKPSFRVGPAAAPIELEGSRIIERVLAKHRQMGSLHGIGRHGAAEPLAQFSAPFHNAANW